MGVPWLDQPLSLAWHPPNECSLNDTTQCEYQVGYWRNWNVADYHYALPTVAFFVVAIVLFAIANVAEEFLPKAVSRSGLARKIRGGARYLSYRNFRVGLLDWNSAPLGLLLLGGVGVIYFLCMTLVPQPYYWPNTPTVDYGDQPPIATRSGWLSIACLPFVFATAGKSNLITGITGISHEKLQIFHRWISYAFFVTALVHTFPFIVYHISIGDMVAQWNTQIYYWTGTIAILAQAWLTFASFGPLRWCYEWFKFSHFAAALIFMIFLFFHCDGEFSAWDYFVATGVLFSVSWLHRQIKIYFEHGFGHKAELCLESSGFIRAAIPTTATWRVGQHFFLRFLTPDLHALMTHPFTACSLPEAADVHDSKTNDLLFYIRPRGGMTARLARSLESSGNRSLRVLLDGPYGGVDMRKLDSCDRTVIIAGGSGAGWTLPIIAAHLRKLDFLTGAGQAAVLPSLRVILATREAETTQWYEEAVREMVGSHGLEKASQLAQVDIFYTGTERHFERPRLAHRGSSKTASDDASLAKAIEAKEIISAVDSSSSSSKGRELVHVQHHTSRPDLPAILNDEAASLSASTQLGVYVCGPLSMQVDVANAIAAQQLSTIKGGGKDVYLHMEHFSWA